VTSNRVEIRQSRSKFCQFIERKVIKKFIIIVR